ncbi:MAG: class I SAM-dependent methyltransferase [Phycisphaerae bacterium]
MTLLDRCDLCGGAGTDELLGLRTGRSLRSDRVIVPVDLVKLRCRTCGLVRSGSFADEGAIAAMYAHEYRGVGGEHLFYTRGGPISRSAVFADWMIESMGAERWRVARRVLEVGAGAGHLLGELARRFPACQFEGIEPGEQTAAAARDRGLRVANATPDRWNAAPYDIVYAVAVIEHVPSPAAFLSELRRLVRPGGAVYLMQPTQETPSYDVFFVDHLHHFAAVHVRAYARRFGLRERGLVVGHPLMPNFSLHLLEAGADACDDAIANQADPPAGPAWCGPPDSGLCEASAHAVAADLRRLDERLADWRRRGRRIGVFGLFEAFALARAYSALGETEIVCGLDDQPDRLEYAALGFPVCKPEECARHGVEEVVLTMNRIYYDQSRARMNALGVSAHPLFAE